MTEVRYRDFWGEGKRPDLLASLDQDERAFEASYLTVDPKPQNRFAFRPRELGVTYQSWPTIRELAGSEPFSGLQEMRRGRLLGVDRAELEARMQRYVDPTRDWAQVVAGEDGPTETTGQFDAERARSRLLSAGAGSQLQIRRYASTPMTMFGVPGRMSPRVEPCKTRTCKADRRGKPGACDPHGGRAASRAAPHDDDVCLARLPSAAAERGGDPNDGRPGRQPR